MLVFVITGKRQLGRHRRRWEDNIKEVGWWSVDWIDLAEGRDRWRELVSTERTFVFHKCGEFLD
jgi:hypothetical protein